jgi:hypothetical protein
MSTTNNTFPQMDTTLTFTKTITRKVRYAVKYEMNYDEFFNLRQTGSGVIENSDKAFKLRVESEWQGLLNSANYTKLGDPEIVLDESEDLIEHEATEEEVEASGIGECGPGCAEGYVYEFFYEPDKERHEEFKSRQEERKKYTDEIAELKSRLAKYESV